MYRGRWEGCMRKSGRIDESPRLVDLMTQDVTAYSVVAHQSHRLFADSQAIALAISWRVVPIAKRDLMSRSIETLGSHRSILAIRDWLDLTRRASSSWVSRLF